MMSFRGTVYTFRSTWFHIKTLLTPRKSVETSESSHGHFPDSAIKAKKEKKQNERNNAVLFFVVP